MESQPLIFGIDHNGNVMKKIITAVLLLTAQIACIPASAKYQFDSQFTMEMHTHDVLEKLNIDAEDVRLLKTDGEITKNMLWIKYRTPLSITEKERKTELLIVAAAAGAVNKKFNAGIDHYWISVFSEDEKGIADFFIPASASEKSETNSNIDLYTATWLTQYKITSYFTDLQKSVPNAVSDPLKRKRLFMILDEMKTGVKNASASRQNVAENIYARGKNEAQTFYQDMIDKNVLTAVETSTSNPIIFVSDLFFEFTAEQQQEFFETLFDSFVVSKHKGLEMLIIYDSLGSIKIGTYDKDGFKPDK